MRRSPAGIARRESETGGPPQCGRLRRPRAARPRGIEIYHGKPVSYSLGHFLMENETVELQPWENCNGVGLGNDVLPGEFYSAIRLQGYRSRSASRSRADSV